MTCGHNSMDMSSGFWKTQNDGIFARKLFHKLQKWFQMIKIHRVQSDKYFLLIGKYRILDRTPDIFFQKIPLKWFRTVQNGPILPLSLNKLDDLLKWNSVDITLSGYPVRTPRTKRQCMKCRWFRGFGVWASIFCIRVLSSGNLSLAFCPEIHNLEN